MGLLHEMESEEKLTRKEIKNHRFVWVDLEKKMNRRNKNGHPWEEYSYGFFGLTTSQRLSLLHEFMKSRLPSLNCRAKGEGKNEQKKKFSIWKLFWTGSGKTIWGGFVQRMFYSLWHL